MNRNRIVAVVVAAFLMLLGSTNIAGASADEQIGGDTPTTFAGKGPGGPVVGPALTCLVDEVPWYTKSVIDNQAAPVLPYTATTPAPVDLPNPSGLSLKDYSGVAHNPYTDTLMVVNNKATKNYIVEYDSTGTNVLRSIHVPFTTDLEDISWMGSVNQWAIVDEDSGEIIVVDIPAGATALSSSDVVYSIDTCLPEASNGKDGIEGIAFGLWSKGTFAESFYVVWEGQRVGPPNEPDSPHLYEFRRQANGDVTRFGPLDLGAVMDDAAAIYNPGWSSDFLNLYILSEDSKEIVVLDSFYNGNMIGQYDLGAFAQPEGMTMSITGDRMFVVGEKDRQFTQYNRNP